jgi:hypothetical protein
MSKALIEKIRRAREVKVTVDGHNYTVRRPTDLEAAELRGSMLSDGELAARFVVGWDLTELDLVPGGAPTPVAFDADLWREFCADRRDLWGPLAAAAAEAFIAHTKEREDATKN